MTRWVLNQLDFHYRRSEIKTFENIQGSFQTGKSYQISGISGSGKTTLLNLLAGLVTCSAGSLTYDEQEIAALDRNYYRRQKVACLFQEDSLLKDSPLANLEMEALLSGNHVDREELIRGLLTTGLKEKQINIPINRLNKRDRQLTALSKLLMKDHAELILIDEPEVVFSDCGMMFAMKLLKRHILQKKKCLIFTTQSTQSVKFADELWGLNRGKLLFIKSQPTV